MPGLDWETSQGAESWGCYNIGVQFLGGGGGEQKDQGGAKISGYCS